MNGQQRTNIISRRLAGLLALLLSTASLTAAASDARETGAVTAFVDGNVLSMANDEVMPAQNVIVASGRIIAIGPKATTPVPAGARRIEGRGAYLLPGLSDMHAHISGYADAGGRPGDDSMARAQLLSYAATGVTLVRNMAGNSAHLELRRRIDAREVVGPRLFTATNIVDGPVPVWPWSIKAGDDTDIAALVASFVDDGYDQIKLYNELPRAVYAKLFDAAAAHDMRVVGHVPFSVGIDAALASGQYSIEHFRGYDYDGVRPQALLINGGRNAERFSSWQRISPDRMRDLVAKTVASGTWNCPTFVIDDQMSNRAGRERAMLDARFRLLHPRMRETLQNSRLDDIFPAEAKEALRATLPQRHTLLRMLDQAGAGLLIGTDSLLPFLIPGHTPIDEMQHFVAAGLSPYRALRAATVEPARFLGLESEAGTVAVGKRADLLLVNDNPLKDLNNLWQRRGVMLHGVWYEEATLQSMLESIAKTFPSETAVVP